jgi:hypothetical protein
VFGWGANWDGTAPFIVWLADVGTEPSQRANIRSIFGMDSLCQKHRSSSFHSNAVSCISHSLKHRSSLFHSNAISSISHSLSSRPLLRTHPACSERDPDGQTRRRRRAQVLAPTGGTGESSRRAVNQVALHRFGWWHEESGGGAKNWAVTDQFGC